jgi:hypothetical protein
MAGSSPDRERYRLLSAWCDGSLVDNELERLEELLSTDREFRSFYIDYMDQHAVLAADALLLRDPLQTDWRPEPIGGREDSAGGAVDAARRWRPGLTFGTPRSWRRWSVAVAALLLVGLGVRFWPASRPEVGVVDGPPAGGASSRLAPMEGFAVVIQLDRAEWEPGDGRRPTEGELLSAGRLVLRSGRITLALLSGVMLTVEGPADFDLLTIDRVHCRRGRLRTHVPDGAEGFVVSTPRAAVVDLGTEFALNVARDGKAHVMVFQGKAEAAVFNAAGSPVRSQPIETHHAFDLDPESGQIEEAVARSENFATPPIFAAPPLALDSTYRNAVLEAGPWAYWRFETIHDGVVPSEVAGRPPLRATGPVLLTVAGASNRCLEFGTDETEQSLALDGLWEPPGDPGYAVELWVMPERIGHAALASLIEPGPPSDDYKHLFLIELTASDRQSLLPPGSVRFLHRWPPSDSGGDNLFSTKYYIPYRWHHLVAQRSGGRMELYLDGVPTEPLSTRSALETEPCRFLVGRLKPEPRPDGRVHSRPFVGRIDEIALYDRPLSAEEVLRHYELGNLGDRPPNRESTVDAPP